MRQQAQYTPAQLKQMFLDMEASINRTPMGKELDSLGLPNVGYYKRAFGTYGNFLKSIGRIDHVETYRKKQNIKRFFYPQEWLKLMNTVINDKHKFWLEMLLHTGARFDEVRNIRVRDIDLQREEIFIAEPKGGRGKQRTIQISTYLSNKIGLHIKKEELGKDESILTTVYKGRRKPITNQFLGKYLKRYCKASGIVDWEDFSCHNIRKTTEMWLIAMNINHLAVVAHIGHNIDVASTFYVSTQRFNSVDKALIKTILDNLLQK